jgi:hypothetical protein
MDVGCLPKLFRQSSAKIMDSHEKSPNELENVDSDMQDVLEKFDSNLNSSFMAQDLNSSHHNVVSIVEDAVELHAGAEDAWNKAVKFVSFVQDTGLSQLIPPEALGQVGKVAQIIIPMLVSTTVSLSAGMPFAGPITALLVQFYGAVSSAIENIKRVRELMDSVDQVTTWLKSALQPMMILKETADPKAYSVYFSNIERHLKNLAVHICDANGLFDSFKEIRSDKCMQAFGSFARAVVFHDKDEEKMNSIATDISKAQNSLSQYFSTFSLALHASNMKVTRNLPQIEKIREALMSPFIFFDEEISEHMANFLKGSREWLHSVREDAYL